MGLIYKLLPCCLTESHKNCWGPISLNRRSNPAPRTLSSWGCDIWTSWMQSVICLDVVAKPSHLHPIPNCQSVVLQVFARLCIYSCHILLGTLFVHTILSKFKKCMLILLPCTDDFPSPFPPHILQGNRKHVTLHKIY